MPIASVMHGDRTLTPEPDKSDPNQAARAEMVRYQIAARGVTDQRVLEAMTTVPRELFVPDEIRDLAFEDRALPIAADQTISQPFIVAAMTAKLQIEPNHRVLEIGTGSGYQTAVLSRLAEEVVTIERIGSLQVEAVERLKSLSVSNVSCRVGDGTAGWAELAPYDGIIVTAGTPSIPQALIDQLALGGRLVLPVGNEKEQTLMLVRRDGDRVVQEKLFPCRFVKLIGEFGWK